MNAGLLYALGAFVCWGLYPLYLAQVASVPALEVVALRTVGCLLFLLAVLALLQRWRWLAALRHQPRQLAAFAASALLLSCNWLVYVYAISSGQVLESSLGYFINPLVSVVLGVMVLQERLRPVQWLAVLLAAIGVGWMTWQTGRLPWMALVLAISFGFYGLLRKTARLGALEGLTLETMLLAPLALPLLGWLMATLGGGALGRGDGALTAWLLLLGPSTALPLLLFSAAARRLPLATLGLVQYVSPTLQFLLGVWVFREPLNTERLLGFVLIWAGLALYSADALRRSRA